MSPYAGLLAQAMLRHQPQRHALMLPPGHPSKKYNDRRGPITPAQLTRHLAGEITLAAPAAHANLAAVLPLDVDSGGLAVIYALLDAARARGLWAWAEFHPRDNWPLEEQRGYVWAAFDNLAPVAQLQLLGRQLVAAAEVPASLPSAVEVRAHNADTRLPFARHTHTGRRGILIFFDGAEEVCIDLNENWEGGMARWASTYQQNDARLLPEAAPLPLAVPRPVAHCPQRTYTPHEIKAAYNTQADLGSILAAAGGRRVSDRLYHCPCGQHRNGDARPSLQLKAARRAAYGALVANGLSPACRFAGEAGKCWDAFNVYMILHGLTFEQMLTHARAVCSLHDAPERPRSGTTAQERGNTPPQAAAGPHISHSQPTRMPAEEPATAQAIRNAAQRWLAQARISPTARATALYLLGQAESHQASWCKRTVATIAEATGTTERTARRCIRQLQQTGILAVQANASRCGADQANVYQLTPPAGELVHGRPLSSTQAQAAEVPPVLVQCPPPFGTQDGPSRGGEADRIGQPCILRLVRGGDLAPVQPDDAPASNQAEPVPPSQFQPAGPHPTEEGAHQAEDAPPYTPAPVPADASADAGAVFVPIPEGMYLTERGELAPRGLPGWSERDPKDELCRQRWRELRTRQEPVPPPPAPAARVDGPQQTSMALGWRPRGRPRLGHQAMQGEIDRLEREARRCFAIGAPDSGRRYRAQARQLRAQLQRSDSAGEPASASDRPPVHALKLQSRGMQTVLEVAHARNP